MPELPEVETIRRGLLPKVVGETLRGATIGDPKVFQFDPGLLEALTTGQSIVGLDRRGKYLIFNLEHHHLVFHLGMTGQLTLRDEKVEDAGQFLRHPSTGLQRSRQHPPDRHTHLSLKLNEDISILFRDVRKFGKIFLFERDSNQLEKLLAKLGIEPFSHEYTLEAFKRRLRRSRRIRIKSLLLDQTFVAGVGNIYADEALFAARVSPAKRVRYLRLREKELLFETIPLVLEKGIRYGGSSLRDYINSDGDSGSAQENLMVYGRENQPCLECGSLIRRVVISQRSTHFCPLCQRP